MTINVAIASIVAWIAHERGRGGVTWLFVALYLSFFGLFVLYFGRQTPEQASIARERRLKGNRECTHCARLVPTDQDFCPCGNRASG